MKKSIASFFLAIVTTISLSTFALADTTIGTNLRFKSAINTAGAGKCIDVAGGQTTTGTPIVQFDCHSGNNQRFSIVDVGSSQFLFQSSLNLNMCIGITNNTNANAHELLRLVPCRINGVAQNGAKWRIDHLPNNLKVFRHFLPSQAGGTNCIDVASGSAANSLWLQLFNCHAGGNQQWNILT